MPTQEGDAMHDHDDEASSAEPSRREAERHGDDHDTAWRAPGVPSPAADGTSVEPRRCSACSGSPATAASARWSSSDATRRRRRPSSTSSARAAGRRCRPTCAPTWSPSRRRLRRRPRPRRRRRGRVGQGSAGQGVHRRQRRRVQQRRLRARTPTKGRHTLAHELTHVVQQRSGPVDGTPTGDGVAVSHPERPLRAGGRGQRRRGHRAAAGAGGRGTGGSS